MLRMVIKNIIFSSMVLYFFSNQSMAQECTKYNQIDLNAGDVISAELLNDIFSRVEGLSTGVTAEELNGSWSCTSFNKSNATENGYTLHSDGLGAYLEQDVTFSLQSDETFLVSYENNLGQNTTSSPPGNECLGKLVGAAQFLMADARDIESSPSNGFPCYNTGLSPMKKIGPSCIAWQLSNCFPTCATSTCYKKGQPPVSPTDLVATIVSDTVSLTWVAGDSAQTGYDIRRKITAVSGFSSIATPTAISYTDSAIVQNNTYWYRVFATNTDGTSVGSNVVKVSYLTHPPVLNLASTISINENTTAIVSVGATDIDGDTLTFSVASQAPGNDASTIGISSAGVLSFGSAVAPDYENPGDYDSNNIYDITVSVSDGYDTVSQDLSVVVLDVSD